MIINIFGSTGTIGIKTLNLIDNNFIDLKINLLVAKSNITLLKKQIKKYNPKYVFIYDKKKRYSLKPKINNTKVLNFEELIDYLKSNKSDLSILAISGYKSLYFLDAIINNTDNLGIASKEAIVSAGHIFKKNKYFNKTNIFPLDSEHYSLHEYFKKYNNINPIKKIIITASGGPFYNKKFHSLKNVKFSQAIKHPKWKMGYKNSIDSATLVNKCLELIEAHYLFDISFNDLKILIHPQAIVHSAIEFENFTTHFNLFKNDMKIPIYNFLNQFNLKIKNKPDDLYINDFPSLSFIEVKNEIFPIYNFFNKIDKNQPQNLIKFNIGNEFAVELFKNKKIKYTDIYKIINKVTSLNLYSPVKTIKDIINYHEEIENRLKSFKVPNM
tara:strand:- start:449 stop:1600 length:1152 start_codon:yes stop_codon:yes gene_type:complete